MKTLKDKILQHFNNRWDTYYRALIPDLPAPQKGSVMIRSPFRDDDHTPSFQINFEGEFAGRWHDFGTGDHGDAFDFFARLRGIRAFPEVMQAIAREFGLADPTPAQPQKPEGPKQVKTLAQRGISGATARAFHIIEGSGNQKVTHRITFPLFDRDGNQIGMKTHKAGQTMGNTAQLYPWTALSVDAPYLYLVNGEPSVWRIWEAGYRNAICGTGGEGAFKTEWVELFRGKAVRLAFDNDDVGRDGMAKTAKMLHGVAASVEMVQWPEDWRKKGDVEDWLNAGHRLEDLAFVPYEPQPAQKEQAVPGKEKDFPALRCLSDVVAQKVTWLWEPRIPIGSLTMLEADPGEGKTFVSLAIATALGLGRGLPDGGEIDPGNSIFLTAEDSLEMTIRPRLEEMGADTDRIFAIDAPFEFDATGLQYVRTMITAHQARLLVIDPVTGFLPVGLDIHRANEVRIVLSRLAKIAAECACAVLIVRHLAKGNASKAIYRGLGSIDFTAAARSVLLCGHDPDEPQSKALVQIKSNLGPMADPLGYSIEQGLFRWTGATALTASRMLAAEADSSAMSEARALLVELLADGPKPAKEVEAEAASADVSLRTLKRAKKALGIVAKRQGGLGDRGAWVWEIPSSKKGDGLGSLTDVVV